MALMVLPGCSQEKKSPSFDEVLTTRRSIRSYDATKKISEAEVRELLTAVQEAPSWANQQPTKYYVAISPEMVDSVKNHIGRYRSAFTGLITTSLSKATGFTRYSSST